MGGTSSKKSKDAFENSNENGKPHPQIGNSVGSTIDDSAKGQTSRTARSDSRRSDYDHSFRSMTESLKYMVGTKTSPTTIVTKNNSSELFPNNNTKFKPRPLDGVIIEEEQCPSHSNAQLLFANALNSNLLMLQQTSRKRIVVENISNKSSCPSAMPSARRDPQTNIITIPASSLVSVSNSGMALCISTNNSSSNLFAMQSMPSSPRYRNRTNSGASAQTTPRNNRSSRTNSAATHLLLIQSAQTTPRAGGGGISRQNSDDFTPAATGKYLLQNNMILVFLFPQYTYSSVILLLIPPSRPSFSSHVYHQIYITKYVGISEELHANHQISLKFWGL